MKEVSGMNFDYNTLKPTAQMTDKDFSELERRCDEIREENKELLELFREDLDDLSDKVIARHLKHVDDFINHYLLREVPRTIACGDEVIGLYLGDYCIRAGAADTPDTLRETAVSLKKFYKSMERHGKVSGEDAEKICAIIKEGLPEWQEKCRE